MTFFGWLISNQLFLLFLCLSQWSTSFASSEFPVKCIEQGHLYGYTLGYEKYFPVYEGSTLELGYGKLGRSHQVYSYEIIQAIHTRASSQIILKKLGTDQAHSYLFPQMIVLSQNFFIKEGKWVLGMNTIFDCQ